MSPIIDSHLSVQEALLQNPQLPCPLEILQAQRVLSVSYISFDEKEHQGQLVVHADIAEKVRVIFEQIRALRFPVQRIIPIADLRYAWDDIRSMEDNNTSGFNYRLVAGTNRISLHAYGRAIDINPLQNPYLRDTLVLPPNAVYDTSAPGTITRNSPLVELFTSRGFIWGGDWPDRKDYQHFEYPL